MASQAEYETNVNRFYIDARPLTPRQRSGLVDLPLLSTLPPDLRESIQRYHRLSDRLMSLASSLLKYYFIHKNARLPWDEVIVSRTSKPHHRPYWSPPAEWTGQGGLEFNVTHQNGLVGLVGCKTPTVQNPTYVSPTDEPRTSASVLHSVQRQIRLGVDVACVREESRSPANINSQVELDDWVDIFGEMFSEQCLEDIRTAPVPEASSVAETMQARLRRFYAFWALKEAYIKMVGEGLLADWLRQLEFERVRVPPPASREERDDDGFSWALRDEEEVKWTPSDRIAGDIKPNLYGKPVNGVRLELVAYEDDFLFATATRGLKEVGRSSWIKLAIEKDIRPCAEGRCKCLGRKDNEIPDNIVSPVSAARLGNDESYRIVQASVERLFAFLSWVYGVTDREVMQRG